jgi:hypothetical protein
VALPCPDCDEVEVVAVSSLSLACPAAGSMMTVRVEVEVRPDWWVAT